MKKSPYLCTVIQKIKFNQFKIKRHVTIEKYKFENRFESLETKYLSVAKKNLQGYRSVGEYAKVYFLDINGEPVEL